MTRRLTDRFVNAWFRDSRGRLLVLLVAAASLGILLVFLGRVDVGFRYDDYHLVRPWSPAELRRAWLRSWDPTGIEPPFYRPLTASLYAVRFALFGLNARGMHVASVLGHGLCAVLLGWFLRRERAPVWVAVFAAWIYAVHPAMPYAQVSWLTNQMHLAQSLVVLTALLGAQAAARGQSGWWAAVVGLAVCAFLLKEDGIMLLPVIGMITALRVWLLGGSPPRRWVLLVVLGGVTVTALFALRRARLGGLGGYGVPGAAALLPNFLKGIETAFFMWPTTRIWQAVASVTAAVSILSAAWLAGWRKGRRALVVTAVAIAAGLSLNVPRAFHSTVAYSVLAWQGLAGGAAISVLLLGIGVSIGRRDRASLFLVAAGLAVALGFDLPFVLVTKREQYHLIALGSTIALAGAAQGLGDLPTRRLPRAAARAALVVALLPFPFLSRHLAADFLPCAEPVITLDQGVKGWWVVPTELKAWIDLKAARCAAGLAPTSLAALPVVTWGLYPEPLRDGEAVYRWTSERPVALFPPRTASVILLLRRPDATAENPVRVKVVSSGGTQEVTLESDGWREVTVPFTSSPGAWLRGSQRVDLLVEPWFVPGARNPESRDLRRHGVQWRLLEQHGPARGPG